MGRADACSTNTECTETQRCVLKDGWQTCKCADGLSGNDCEKNDWCEDPGKFKDCKGEYGTCEYSKEKRSVLCTCSTGKKVHPKENICKETCNEDTECKYEGKCEMKVGGNKFCSCKLGLTGDKCQTVFDCSPSGKYKGCENSGGKCKYDGSKAVCECSGNKKLDDKENVCKDTCSKDEECKDAQKCVEKDGWKTCQCADGLSGDDCEKLQWCEGTGKFKNCKGDNGTCEYSKEKRTVVCTCAVPERKLHPNENRCRETCADDTECKFGGKCEGNDGGNKFCSCNLGLTGDKCQTVFDCSSTGKYKGCENSGGKCKYDGSKAVCECSGNNKLHDKENVCKDPVCQQGTIQSGGASVIVWDLCSWRDMRPLIRLETTLTGDRYLSVLYDHLHSFMPIVYPDGLRQFQQDNATPHASRVATKWLQEHSSDFRHFHCPPKSPEMNIIEDIRDALLHAVEKRSPPPRTPMDLLTALQDSWCEFPPGYL
ncbi:hypothetical protein AVEN_154332-1 [Araneus ventricosus]|uniref:EGF-like domain-containing protein n=1 Tax=Araneus ventricosus TaxID=182803 RepID=A0A4Y2NIR7_ARAVE|nr:hypothetical protein AVEN_154332-1 [Araneus ventricosus]